MAASGLEELQKTLPEGHTVKLNVENSRRVQKKGRDDDEDVYDQFDENGKFVRSYDVWHRMSIYPPFNVDTGFKPCS